MKENKKVFKDDVNYDMENNETENGEFVCSYFAWVPLLEQKERVDKMENITKDNRNVEKINTKKKG